MHRKISSRTLLSLFIIVPGLMLAACVPSPTATPSGRTPLPTLSSIDGTPQVVANGTAPASQTTPGATRAPRPTNASPRTTRAAQETDTFPPLVEITVQDPELPVSTKQTVALNVLAADNDTIARIDLYDNNVLYAQATAPEPAPVLFHQFQWSRSAPGKHTLRAVAFDASGNASSPAQIELNVITNNRAPGVMITAPSGLKDAEIGAPLLIQGVATDDVAVTRMELIVDNQLVTAVKPTQPEGITPFAVAIPWTPLTTGSHNIVLRAYDNQNQSDDSLRYTVRVFDNQAPVVEAKPERLNLPSGDVFLTEVLALANNGIARVELYVDEQFRSKRPCSPR